MSWYEITVLFLTGLFAGFVNTLAGGGSIVSFSILLMFGLPPSIANGTNRINVLTQTFIASSSFKFQKVLDTKKAPRLFNGNCSSPAHCCKAIFPVTERSTLFVSQSLHATDSN
jgi:uncharacterized membrane protein YfcA